MERRGRASAAPFHGTIEEFGPHCRRFSDRVSAKGAPMTQFHKLDQVINRLTLLKGSVLSGRAALAQRLFAGSLRSSSRTAGVFSTESRPVVVTTAGKVRGTTAKGINIFKG